MELTLDQIREEFYAFLAKNDALNQYFVNIGDKKLDGCYYNWISCYFDWGYSSQGYCFWNILHDKWYEICKKFTLIDESKYKYKIGDIVEFRVKDQVVQYEITVNHLFNITKGGYNSQIFDLLGITNPQKFCTKIYGYKAGSIGFPTCNANDLKAIEKIIKALKEKCFDINSTWKKPEEKQKSTSNKILQPQFEFRSIKKKTYFI